GRAGLARLALPRATPAASSHSGSHSPGPPWENTARNDSTPRGDGGAESAHGNTAYRSTTPGRQTYAAGVRGGRGPHAVRDHRDGRAGRPGHRVGAAFPPHA